MSWSSPLRRQKGAGSHIPSFMLRGVDAQLWQRLREKAASLNISLKTAVIAALTAYVQENR